MCSNRIDLCICVAEQPIYQDGELDHKFLGLERENRQLRADYAELEARLVKYKDLDVEYATKLHECQDTIESLLRENEILRRENGEFRDNLLCFKKAHLKEENPENA